MNRQLIEANVNKDIEKIKTVENLMLELLDSWKQIVNGNNEEPNQEDINIKS
jgi:flagellin-specific chaperone FliS